MNTLVNKKLKVGSFCEKYISTTDKNSFKNASLKNIVFYNKKEIPFNQCYLKIYKKKKPLKYHIFCAASGFHVKPGHIILNDTQRDSMDILQEQIVICERFLDHKDVTKPESIHFILKKKDEEKKTKVTKIDGKKMERMFKEKFKGHVLRTNQKLSIQYGEEVLIATIFTFVVPDAYHFTIGSKTICALNMVSSMLDIYTQKEKKKKSYL